MRAVLFPLLLCLAALGGCRVSLPEDGQYRCASDADCGGGGYGCAHASGSLSFCCLPGAAGCPLAVDGGAADGGGGGCPGVDLQNDPLNCGACGLVCPGGQACVQGGCVNAGETNCATGEDEDGDGKTDCEDSDCEGKSCGVGCGCKEGKRSEMDCRDGKDNDGNGPSDCVDPACTLASCGQGCVCNGGGKSESSCTDGLDNDGDGLTDCADLDDCTDGAFCRAAPTTAVCGAGACTCNGVPAPLTEATCRDGLDNDCNGLVDCADSNCNGSNCNPDGGFGCVCAGGKKQESNCNQNSGDEDGDGLSNCADPDCLNVTCGGSKRCSAGGSCN